MKLRIAPEIFTQFPNTFIGVVVAKDVDNKRDNEGIEKL